MPRAFVVVNPVSGISNKSLFIQQVSEHFLQAGWELTLYETTGSEVVKDVVRKTLDEITPELVVACGGDGTVAQVASGLVNRNVPLGMVPLGTFNALARNMGIPMLASDALRLLTGMHRVVDFDALEVNGSVYLANVGVGLSSGMIGSTARAEKRRFGFFAYLWHLGLTLIGLRQVGFHLVIDDKHIKTRAAEVMISNGSVIGMGELPTRLNIQPDDGRADVIIMKPRTFLGLIPVAWNLLVRGKNRAPNFRYYPACRSVSLKTKKPMKVQGDGEVIGSTPLVVNLLHHAIRLVVPGNDEGTG